MMVSSVSRMALVIVFWYDCYDVMFDTDDGISAFIATPCHVVVCGVVVVPTPVIEKCTLQY